MYQPVTDETIVLVCGLGRSGTSKMMRALQAGGMHMYYDPNMTISFESKLVLGLPDKSEFMEQVKGRALKIINPAVYRPPSGHDYRIIWMDRDKKQQIRSQVKFIREISGDITPEFKDHLKANYKKNLKACLKTIHALSTRVLRVSFESAIRNRFATMKTVANFLDNRVDPFRMQSAIVKRHTDCYDGFLETMFMKGDN
jgi:hypothetical protein